MKRIPYVNIAEHNISKNCIYIIRKNLMNIEIQVFPVLNNTF